MAELKHLRTSGSHLQQAAGANLTQATREAVDLSRANTGRRVTFTGRINVAGDRLAVRVDVQGNDVAMSGPGAHIALYYWRRSALSRATG